MRFVFVLIVLVTVCRGQLWNPSYYCWNSNVGKALYDSPCGEKSTMVHSANLYIILRKETCGDDNDETYGLLYAGVWVKMSQLRPCKYLFTGQYLVESYFRNRANFGFDSIRLSTCSGFPKPNKLNPPDPTIVSYQPLINKAINQVFKFGTLDQILYYTQIRYGSKQFKIWEELVAYEETDKDSCNPRNNDKNNFKGRGPLFLKGKCKYQACDDDLKLRLMTNRGRPATPEYGFTTSAWVWEKDKKLGNLVMAEDDFRDVGLNELGYLNVEAVIKKLTTNTQEQRVRRFHFLNCFAQSFYRGLTYPFAQDPWTCMNMFGCPNSTSWF